MKKLFVLSIMLVASFTFAAAQQGQGQRGQFGGTPEERAKAAVDRLTPVLTLTDDQKTKIQAIELDLNKQMDAKRQSAQGDREAMMALMQEFNKLREEKYKPVLSVDQFKKYQEDAAQRQQRGPGGGQR
jgi:Spy/CpxP family protein refolding chaperone